ncbi:LysR family transcriptional regulator [Microbaculum marinum]|uniref:LysR family transcriptional regulator n=1 Tax=Microbaculum marinum TaxID=1764581 RepID=A0AAW9RDA8_9HYPH
MKLTLRQLEAVVSVADTGSFTAAASRLLISQPSLSEAIHRTETELGVRIFERTTRSLKLTSHGRRIVDVAREAVEKHRAAIAEIGDLAQGRHGRITIAALPSLAHATLPNALLAFRRDYPDLQVSVLDAHHDTALEAVQSGIADVGLTMRPTIATDLCFEDVGDDPFTLVAGRKHALLDKADVAWRELLGTPFIALARGSSVRRLTDRALETAGIALVPAIETASVSSATAMACAGLGVTALPRLALTLVEESSVGIRPLVDAPLKRKLGVLRQTKTFPSSFVAAMVACLTEAIGTALARTE